MEGGCLPNLNENQLSSSLINGREPNINMKALAVGGFTVKDGIITIFKARILLAELDGISSSINLGCSNRATLYETVTEDRLKYIRSK